MVKLASGQGFADREIRTTAADGILEIVRRLYLLNIE